MKFKLLALRINSDFPFTKNLKPDLLYKFSDDIVFENDKQQQLEKVEGYREITKITDQQSYPQDLYAIKGFNDRKIDVNISAVLGRNGSGKSTLLELLYLTIFCLAEQKDLLHRRSFLEKQISQYPDITYWSSLRVNTEKLLETVNIELYYQLNDEYLVLTKAKKAFLQYVLKEGKWVPRGFEFKKFFYSICINYSQYGLNSMGSFDWLTPLFSKNDGYRTPIVLNPYREEGNINVNTELHLAQTRILTNLSSEDFNSSFLIDDKAIKDIIFKIRPARLGAVEESNIVEVARATFEENKVDLISFFSILMIAFGGSSDKLSRLAKTILELRERISSVNKFNSHGLFRVDEEKPDLDSLYGFLATYIMTKVLKISNKYAEFMAFTTPYFDNKGKFMFNVISDPKGLSQQILNSQNHVTLKLKQAINAHNFGLLDELDWATIQDDEYPEYSAYTATLTFDKIKSLARNSFSAAGYKGKILAQFVPVAFFNPTIHVTSGDQEHGFSQLSSGEQQMVHSIHSILYHLINIDSIREGKYSYEVVNLILDEIELYYHPSYQRDFLRRLLENIEKINLKKISGLNIVFSTHSPFILSDIPHTNVLRLQRGEPFRTEIESQTFGANIHDMLADSFFLDEKLIGSYAEKIVGRCISHLEQMRLYKLIESMRSKKDKTASELDMITILEKQINGLEYRIPFESFQQALQEELQSGKLSKTIRLVGEPVVRFKLMEMYDELIRREESEKDRAKRYIQELMRKNNIDLNEL
ncbi:AAA family ATPase [Pedobacter sp. SG908]|uniref:AAA family ATPase n=1 Tax=Pedobacter sp. SG908 TaxID=2587135 RepID=UPI00141DF941|nr:AAA family ATPase [Pedobacter sp. SG908]NII83160.1 putative ATPase [Pedobacter sp. SG908]